MSEPTYRVDLSHTPGNLYSWRAAVVRLADDEELKGLVADSREEAFGLAVKFVYDLNHTERGSSVYLSEDGDLLDPHEVQR